MRSHPDRIDLSSISALVEAGFEYHVAEENGTLIGFVGVRENSHLHHLFVAEAAQRKGVASRLWNTAKHVCYAAGNQGRFTVNSSDNAIPVYEAFGFERTAPTKNSDGVLYNPMTLAEVTYPTKACPIVFRRRVRLEVLAFEHPLAGFQLVKGTIERGESAGDAAVRELAEESGVLGKLGDDLGTWRSMHLGQLWSLWTVAVSPSLPDEWVHDAPDDGGHRFRFFWHELGSNPNEYWDDDFRRLLLHVEALSISVGF